VSRQRVVYVIAAMALAIVALVGCDAMPGRPRPADQPTLPSRVMGFAGLYGQFCAGCHGTDGRLGAARPLNDPVYLALVPQDRLRMIIAQGVPGTAMPGFATGAGGPLTEAQVDALIHEMLQRWSRPLPPPEGPLPPYAAPAMGADGSPAGDPERGLRVYAEACAGCHGADGKGAKGGIGRGCRLSRPGERSTSMTTRSATASSGSGAGSFRRSPNPYEREDDDAPHPCDRQLV
jgi:mono/diheme cytochrome c family protein